MALLFLKFFSRLLLFVLCLQKMKSDVNKYFCIRLKLTVVRSRTSNFKKMEAFCKFVTLSLIRYLILIPPVYEAKPLIQSNEIESIQYKNHKNFHNGLSSLSRFLTNPSSTTIPSTTSTTPHSTISHFGPVHHYSCVMCGMTFNTVEDVKKHYVNQHNADPTVIYTTRGKFFISFSQSSKFSFLNLI